MGRARRAGAGLFRSAADRAAMRWTLNARVTPINKSNWARRIPLDLRALRRGDLIFWKGHVGMMQDAATLLHANAYHMQVASEQLADAVARIAQSGSQITGIRRLPKLGG